MAVYKRQQTVGNNGELTDGLTLNEQHLYGSSRLGLRSLDNTLNSSTFESLGLNLFGEYEIGSKTAGGATAFDRYRTHRPLGAKNYELSNHLGNVLATVSDRKLWSGSTRIADVKSASDYYPFGMEMADRTMSLAGYRYGFNGKEKDPSGEWGSQAIYDYGFRIYNPGLGKFLSVDPLAPSYSALTTYQFASNSPIAGIDIDGLEFKQVIIPVKEDGTYDRYNTVVDIDRDAKIYQGVQRVALTEVTLKYPDGNTECYQIFEEVDEHGKNADGIFPSARYNFNDKDPNYKIDQLERQAEEGILGNLFSLADNRRNKLAPERIQSMKDFWNGMEAIGALAGAYISAKSLINGPKSTTTTAASIINNTPCGCFTESTLVHTENGLKPISEILVGNEIWSYNDSTKIKDLKRVNNSIIPLSLYTKKEEEAQKFFNEKEDAIIAYSPKDKIVTRDIDKEEITPYTWKWIHFEIKEDDGSYTKVYLRRPNWWLKEAGATEIGKIVPLSMYEIGVGGEAKVTKISPNQLDTRFWNLNRDGDYVSRPITGKVEHYANNVVDLYFGNSVTKPLSVTTNHLFWSFDRDDWFRVDSLRLGERIKTQRGNVTLTDRISKEGWFIVYDLEVYRDHNFLVTKEGLLVHNNCAKIHKALKEKIAKGKWKDPGYHAHFSDEIVLDIINNFDQVYVSTAKKGNLIYRKGDDIVVVGGSGTQKNKVITGYGPSGIKGTSGAKALGGNASDAGGPITHEMIINGKIPNGSGGFIAPATPTKVN